MSSDQNKIIDSGKPTQAEGAKRRREVILTVLIGILFAGTTYFEYRLSHISNQLPFVNSIFFFGLINFNIILLMILVLLISRNVGKLLLERRRKTSGSRLKTKLVVSFLSFTIIPTGILFLISAFYINSSFDKWFSIKIQNTLQTSIDITDTYYKNTSRVSQYLAKTLANEVNEHSDESAKQIQSLLNDIRKKSAVDGIEFYSEELDERVYSAENIEDLNSTLPRLPLDVLEKSFKGETVSLVQHIGGADLIRSLAPVGSSGGTAKAVLAVTYVIPASLVNRVDAISSVFQDYKEVNPLKYPVKTTYFLILIMMTALIMFVSIWIGLYIARELTVPLDRLVTATQKIRTGDLDFQILNTGNDEIARLTDSFNEMTGELKRHRSELQERNAFVETILNSVTAGVITVDERGNLTTLNPFAAQLLSKNLEKVRLDIPFELALGGRDHPLVDLYFQYKERGSLASQEPVNKQFSLGEGEESKTYTASISPFRNGVLIVIDDTTYIFKAQREAAWREVARRIAHEIKNPLTPIKLSAQRLQKRFVDSANTTDAAVLNECTSTIIQHVDELRDMVNEFSNFARLPEVNPAPNNLNEALKEVVTLYEQAHRNIQFQTALEDRLPLVSFDRDQMKRVLINLVDNAVAVGPKKVGIKTHFNEKLKIAVIEVEDDGPGMSDEVKARVFEPYFSTKKEGTGLGLAIVKRIVSDHSGFIRVASKLGQGTKFIIELPIETPVKPNQV